MTEFARVGELHTLLLLSFALFAIPSPPLPGLLAATAEVADDAAAAAANASNVELWRLPLASFGLAALVGRRAIGFAMVRRVCCCCCAEVVVAFEVSARKEVHTGGVMDVCGRQDGGGEGVVTTCIPF